MLGGAVATAIYSAILSSKFTTEIPSTMMTAIEDSGVPYSDSLLESLIAAAATNTLAAYQAVKGVTPDLVNLAGLATKLAYVEAFELVYLVAIGFGGLATIAAFCTVSTDPKTKSSQRAVIMKNEVPSSDEKISKAV